MKKFISLSQYPGKTGLYFYTEFFKHYNIDAVYEPRSCDNIEQSLKDALNENISGISISMPFKKTVIPLLNQKTAYVELYNSCNTIKIDKESICGYNADLAGVEQVAKHILLNDRITVLGAGAIGSMFVKYLEHSHYDKLNVCARNLGTWNERYKSTDIVINCTALGTSTEESPYKLGQIPTSTRLVIDLSIKDNEFKQQCQTYGIKYISGREFYRSQFLKQFEIYTGIKPDPRIYDQIESKQYESNCH
jgi:shikimate dehydrogenase